jgi:hypothetical protein
MYDDKDPWPFKCPECGEEFTKEIGWLKAQSPAISIRCPGVSSGPGAVPCPVTLRYSAEDFRRTLAEAKARGADVFRYTWTRKERP